MNIENKIKELADIASNFDLEDTRKAWENKSNDVVEYRVRVSDAIRMAKEYAEKIKQDLRDARKQLGIQQTEIEMLKHENEQLHNQFATDKEKEKQQ